MVVDVGQKSVNNLLLEFCARAHHGPLTRLVANIFWRRHLQLINEQGSNVW